MKARIVFSFTRLWLTLPFAIFTFIITGCVHANAAPSAESAFDLINQRLSYMEDVALYKAYHHLPIEDRDREQQVISAASQSAEALGLDRPSVEALIAAQIAVAKAVQYRHRADWLSTPPDRLPKDLSSQIRPQLIELGDAIFNELAGFLRSGKRFTPADKERFDALITVRHVSNADKHMLFSALEKVTLTKELNKIVDAVIEGSAEHPDPILQKVLTLEKQGIVKNVKVLERFPVQIHLSAPVYIIEQLKAMPRKAPR